MTATPDLRALADRLQATADGDDSMLALARGLRLAVDAEQPAIVIAQALHLPTKRRSPARLARDQAFRQMAACQRYAGLRGKPLFERMLLDLTRYAASSAWAVDRRQTANPYLATDWHAGAWDALKLDPTAPRHWKTLKRSIGSRGQVFLSTDHPHVDR